MTENVAQEYDTRLIERWLPIAALGEESVRERRSMTALPPIYYLHVWWARRPLVASRAALLASVLPAGTNREAFLRILGIHGDPIAARKKIDAARRSGLRVKNPYDWERAFSYTPDQSDRDWFKAHLTTPEPLVLDPTAGGGSIPFETVRLGLNSFANDLNPVAALITRATVEWPLRWGGKIENSLRKLAKVFRDRIAARLADLFPQRHAPDQLDITYLWARTIRCPYCEGRTPLSPNWRLAPGGMGVRIHPHLGNGVGDLARRCTFEVVSDERDHSTGTVLDGDGMCPYPDCGRPINGDDIKAQAQTGQMGEQLFAVALKRRIETRTKNGKRGRDKWERGFRAPDEEDEREDRIASQLSKKMEEWQILDVVPSESIWSNGRGSRVNDPGLYGVNVWRDFFNPRQMLCHGTAVEVFREILAEEQEKSDLTEIQRVAFIYLSLAMDKIIDYGSRYSTWDWTTGRVRHVFVRHEFSFKWSYAEMSPLVEDLGYDWAIQQTASCVRDLVGLGSGPIKC